ncbi:hypothetical protein BDV12DRAFT_204163 [Aspergillus spectabilis]
MKRKSITPASRKGKSAKTSDSNDVEEPSISGPVYELDPSGDVIFVVHNVPEHLPSNLKELTGEVLGGLSEIPKPPEIASGDSSPKPPETTESLDARNANQAAQEPTRKQDPLQIKASSKHLILSCPHFNRMFSSKFKESSDLERNGYLRLQEDQWEALPFLVLLLIIHGRMRSIPRKVSLKTLTDIAVLVDYYGCYEAVEVFSDMWIDHLEGKVSKSLNDDTLKWLFISWAFQKRSIFKQITETIQCESTDSFQWGSLPIPQTIIGRVDYLERIINALRGLFNSLVDGTRSCKVNAASSDKCSYNVLGAFTRHLISMKLGLPEPKPPYAGLAVKKVLKECRTQMKSPSIHGSSWAHPDECVLERHIDNILRQFPGPDGLDLDGEQFTRAQAGAN